MGKPENYGLRNLCCSPNIIRMNKSRRMRLGLVELLGGTRNAYEMVEEPEDFPSETTLH
jgi:hypothetical protein